MSRESLMQVATHLLDLKRTLPHEPARKLLAECATQLSALAEELPRDHNIPVVQQACMVAEAREVAADLGIPQRSAAMLLAILLATPGSVLSVHRLAAMMGISTTSVRVFACTLRKWLAQGGIGEAIECRWGVGYVIDPHRGDALLEDYPSLKRMVTTLRESEVSPCLSDLCGSGGTSENLAELIRM